MPPLSVPISDGDPSTAFFDQFSTIIRLEARLYGDHSEDEAGPEYLHWVVKHLADVARAQGFTAQATTLNVHAQEFTTPPPTQAKISSRPVHSTPWYENFNLADQGVYDPSDPYHPTEPIPEPHPLSRSRTPYTAFDPVELAQYRTVIREQLVHSSNQSAEKQPSASHGCHNYIPDLHRDPSQIPTRSRLPTTPPNNLPRVRCPSTPPNLPHRRLHLASPTEPFPDLDNDTTLRSLRASTEPLPSGQILDHYLCEVSEHEARPGK